ncbi:SRPBCC domain-containing protein [Carboxydochorda subterranea]|uniref:SRPBCC domain-containing protein n=1 Tax=Carboxydichorda subterranea TaxID=3109565 RepID=A0ABZ1C1T0_9FIRM|nr:SRPBCC domain-containing protein [Limnochorda sp. L945t]WRP18726.1 SRPBCC domain-containing protein [Limnochorda sp. L945t]
MTTQVRRYVVVNAPVERVWQALLEADQLERWLCQRAEVDISSCI